MFSGKALCIDTRITGRQQTFGSVGSQLHSINVADFIRQVECPLNMRRRQKVAVLTIRADIGLGKEHLDVRQHCILNEIAIGIVGLQIAVSLKTCVSLSTSTS